MTLPNYLTVVTVGLLTLVALVAFGAGMWLAYAERRDERADLARRHRAAVRAARRQAWNATHAVAVATREPLRVEASRLDVRA